MHGPAVVRVHTSAAQVDDKHLLVFGGLDKRIRYNDVWVYSTEDKEWTQVVLEGPCPEPRAHFTATKFGSKILIFGGYGGNGQVISTWSMSA